MAPPRRPPKKNRLPLVLAMGGVLLLAVIAIVATRGGSNDSDDRAGGGASAGTEETRPVHVTGEALPDYSAENDAGVGRDAPRVEGATFDGTPVTVGGGVGVPQLVMVVAHWCPHCQKEVPVIADWLRDRGAPSGVELRGVSTSVNPDAPNHPPSEWLEEEGWTLPTLADDGKGTAARALGVTGYPFFVAIDGRGKVVTRTSGELTIEAIEQLVAAARTGRA